MTAAPPSTEFIEMQRQVRSLLAVVRSIVRRTAHSCDSIEDYAAHLEGRIGALARIQGFLLRTPGAEVDLEELVCSEMLAQSVPEHRSHVSGETVRLAREAAQPLGLALHELATNALKFGALSGTTGSVEVSWELQQRTDGPPELRLEWRERVDSGAIARPSHKGFGTELIERTLPYELRARTALSFAPGGVCCVIEFPLESPLTRADSASS